MPGVSVADRRPPDGDPPGEFDPDGPALLDRLRPDIAVICTPIHTHAEFAERAMRAGAHLLLEKPPVTGLADHERLLRVAAATGRHVQVGFQAFGSSVVRELLDRRAELEPGVAEPELQPDDQGALQHRHGKDQLAHTVNKEELGRAPARVELARMARRFVEPALRALAIVVRTYALNGTHYSAAPGHLSADLS